MITVTIHNYDDDSEAEHEFPSKMEVCDECQGESYVLCEGMRGHAYSREEFEEAFDDEDREHYFRRGGKYDVICPSCKGKNVIAVVDEDKLTPEQKVLFEEYQEQESERHRMDAEDRHTMRMESGCWD